MKIKYLLLLSLVLLLPVASNATDSVEEFCDNIIYNEAYDAHHYKPDNASHLRYVLGDRGNKGKYKYEVLKFCDRKDFCAQAQFGEVLLGDHRSLRLNMVAYALEFNNIEVFETLILNRPEFSYLIDSGLYAGEEKILSNWGFVTPALNSIKNGQVGVLKYLIKKYNVNLFKRGGHMYRRVPDYIPLDGKGTADKAINQWSEKTPNNDRLKCAKAVQKVVEQWYIEHENDKRMIREAEEYNRAFIAVASQKDYMLENIAPFKFTPSLDIFKLQNVEENFTQNIDNKIDVLMNKIIRDFDLSYFGNPA